LLCPTSPIYRRKEGGGCRPARPGELGFFHQKAPPSFGTLGKAQVGLIAICTLLFTKYTPSWCFFIGFFPKRCRTLRIMQRHLFSFRNVANFYGLCNNARFPFGNVVKLYGLRNDACFEGSERSKQGSRTDRKYSRTKLGYDRGCNIPFFVK